ncbi:MAG: hypothetical protein QXF45_04675 [Candidatus Caldarchaeum sp.]|uniref:Uncharacterized protein n=1 Tax=Caldiarchaeum subterraneum TaxID=311458 RepID=A0A7C5YAE7_CALS0
MFSLDAVKCVCGRVVDDVNDIRLLEVSDSVKVYGCNNGFCVLDKLLEIRSYEDMVELRFLPMFSDYNLLMMGRDAMEKRLQSLGKKLLTRLLGGKALKTRIMIR